jgi:transketolase
MEKKYGLATRDAYGKTLVELGKDPRIVVLDADLSKSTKTEKFGQTYPERFFNVGICEANMVGMASGFAMNNKIPFVSSFACFIVCKGYDQLRMSVAFPELNVKIVSSHGGISIGEDGASQQSIEDVALMSTLPGFAVMVPSDEHCTSALIRQSAERKGPVYVRTGRPKAPLVHNEKTHFEIGKGVSLREGTDVTLFANGLLVWEALAAAEMLAKKGLKASVIDLHTIKPLDEQIIIDEARRTGCFVCAEEHQIWGGMGSAISRLLAEKGRPVPMEFVAVQDTYAESATPDELMIKYGLTAAGILTAAERVIARKKRG